LLTDPTFAVQFKHKPRPKRERDSAHLDFVRSLPCSVCLKPGPSEAHHLLRGVPRGMGRKADDRHVIPLCHECHTGLHLSGNEVDFLTGIDGPDLAARLYEAEDYEGAIRGLIR